MATVYNIGDEVRITTTFTNLAGAATDPSEVSFKIETPAGVETEYKYTLGQVVKSATGVYYLDVYLSAHGIWRYRVAGTGTLKAVVEGSLSVQTSHFD